MRAIFRKQRLTEAWAGLPRVLSLHNLSLGTAFAVEHGERGDERRQALPRPLRVCYQLVPADGYFISLKHFWPGFSHPIHGPKRHLKTI